MDFSDRFLSYRFDEENALKNGFHFSAGVYSRSYVLPNSNMRLLVSVSKPDFQVILKVFDNESDEPYSLWRADSATGSFVGLVRTEIEETLESVLRQCFLPKRNAVGQKEKILTYIGSRFGEEEDFPFEDKTISVVRCENNRKWYVLFMEVDLAKFGLPKGPGKILNLKIGLDDQRKLYDGQKAFPAYHMNKKLWCSIPLDREMPDSVIFELVEKSRKKTLCK